MAAGGIKAAWRKQQRAAARNEKAWRISGGASAAWRHGGEAGYHSAKISKIISESISKQ